MQVNKEIVQNDSDRVEFKRSCRMTEAVAYFPIT